MHFNNHNWVLPEFPELGWNDVPPPIVDNDNAQHDAVPDNGVGPEEPVEVQSQESMVLQVSDDSVNNDNGPAVVHNASIVPLHPEAQLPAQQVLHIGQILTVFGPILPPQMQWTRTFCKYMQQFDSTGIQRPLQMPLFNFIKQSWSHNLSIGSLDLSLLPPPFASEVFCQLSPVKRPVAHALCFVEPSDLSEPVSEKFKFSSMHIISNKRSRKSAFVGPILLDSQVRRSARLSALRDGFCHAPLGSISPQPVKRNKKRKTSAMPAKTASAPDEPVVPPPTAISDLQLIGARLWIAPEKITAERLVADPSEASSSKGSDDE